MNKSRYITAYYYIYSGKLILPKENLIILFVASS